MLKPILRNEQEQITFERDGYIVIRKLIPPKVVNELKALYATYEKEHYIDQHGMSNSSHISNAEVLFDIYRKMESLVAEYADKHLTNYKFFVGSFLVKKSGEDSFFDLHQDRTLVEEPLYCSLNFWISLDEINASNGRLFVLKGTPRLQPYIRTAPQYSMKWNQIKGIAPFFYTYINTEAGDVVLFNHATFHGSEKNRSGRSRMAAAMGVYSADSPLYIYYKDANTPPNMAERYIVNTQILTNLPRLKGRPPQEAFSGYVSLGTAWEQSVTPEEFQEFMMQQLDFKETLTVFGRKWCSLFQNKN